VFARYIVFKLRLWNFDARREKRQAPAPPVAVTAAKDHGSLSDNQSPAPAKPPRTYESDIDQIENVEPVVAEVIRAGPSSAKRRAPLAPTSVSVRELSPLHTSTPISSVPSPVKMMKVDEEEIDSPARPTKGKYGVETLTALENDQTVGVHGNQTNGVSNKPVNNVEEKGQTVTAGHVSSATLIFGGTAVAASSAGVTRSTPAKVAVIQKTVPSGSQLASVSKTSSQSSADDSMVDEPTSKPVAARLAAWQTKVVATADQEPQAVSSRVKSFERKITAESASEKTKTPLRLRTQTEPASNKSKAITSVKMSPVRAGAAVATNSPVKSVLSSPQKLSPATRAIQERLTQICEAGTRNSAVDRERKERAAELADVGNRWQRSPTTAASSVSRHFAN